VSRPNAAVRGILITLWLISIGLVVVGCVNLLVALKTGSSLAELAGGKGFLIPPWLFENPAAFFFLNCTIAPGYFSRPFEPGAAAAFLLIVLVIALAGGVILCRSALRAGTAGQSGRARLSLGATILGAGLLTAGAVSLLLEISGFWQRLALHPDPLKEQGAPFWFWWACAVLAVTLWYFALRKPRAFGRPWSDWAKRLAWLAANALLLAAISLVFHILQPEPTQGRYYGIAGFVVGRADNSEYGTYYGMVSGITVFLISLMRLAWILLSARSRRRPENWF